MGTIFSFSSDNRNDRTCFDVRNANANMGWRERWEEALTCYKPISFCVHFSLAVMTLLSSRRSLGSFSSEHLFWEKYCGGRSKAFPQKVAARREINVCLSD
jgi:hypothetical protein